MSVDLMILVPAFTAFSITCTQLYTRFGPRRPFSTLKTGAILLLICGTYGGVAALVAGVASLTTTRVLSGIVGLGGALALGSAEAVGSQANSASARSDRQLGKLGQAVTKLFQQFSEFMTGYLDRELLAMKRRRCEALMRRLLEPYAKLFPDGDDERTIPYYERLHSFLDVWVSELTESQFSKDIRKARLEAAYNSQKQQENLIALVDEWRVDEASLLSMCEGLPRQRTTRPERTKIQLPPDSQSRLT